MTLFERWAQKVVPQHLMQLARHADIETTLEYYVGQNAGLAADAAWDAEAKSTDTLTDTLQILFTPTAQEKTEAPTE